MTATIQRPDGPVRPAPWANAYGAIDFSTPDAPARPDTWAAARKIAGLEWEPLLEAATRNILVMTDNGPAKQETPVQGHQWIVRSDTSEVLEHCKSTYHTISNSAFGQLVDTFLNDKAAGLRIEIIGQSYGGRKVWALLGQGHPITLPGDPSPYEQYILLCNTHDGDGACRTLDVTRRIWCQNMWNAAVVENRQRGGNLKSFHHRSGWQRHMDILRAEVEEAIAQGLNSLTAFAQGMTDLLATKVTSKQADWFVKKLCDKDFDNPQARKDRKEKTQQAIDAHMGQLWTIMNGPTSYGIQGTAGWLANSASEWLDHVREVRGGADAYLQRTVLSQEKKKRTAIELAREAALV